MNSVGSNDLSLKYQRLSPSGCKVIVMRKFKLVAMTQFLVLINNICAENLHVLHKCYFIAHCTGSGGRNFPDSSLSAPKLQIQGKYQGLEIQSALCI